MLKAVWILSSEYGDSNVEILKEDEENDDYNFNAHLELNENEEEGSEPDKTDCDSNVLEEIETGDIELNFQSNILTGIRCAAHTLQLAIDDALKKQKLFHV
ncbi:unnamed protein product [Lasius platythorax]|uniref:Uncharacterized protein n=1 Tax=Lasius platythorax TaxID=488582 RepID=A0AAV2P0U0_9HYME